MFVSHSPPVVDAIACSFPFLLAYIGISFTVKLVSSESRELALPLFDSILYPCYALCSFLLVLITN